jgi:hypothetical protein
MSPWRMERIVAWGRTAASVVATARARAGGGDSRLANRAGPSAPNGARHEDGPRSRRSGRPSGLSATFGGMRLRVIAASLAVAAVLVIAGCGSSGPDQVTFVTTVPSGQQPPAATATSVKSTSLAILRRSVTASDRLPEWISTNVSVKIWGALPHTARFALRTPAHRYWVTRGVYQGRPSTCLIDALANDPSATYRPGRPGGINCQPNGVFGQDFIVANMSYPPATTDTYGGVVPDGYSQVHFSGQTAPVINNAFEITGSPAQSITATGPAGSRTVWFWQPLLQNPPSVSAELPLRILSTPPTPAAHLPSSVHARVGRHQYAWLLGTDRSGGRYWLISTGRAGALLTVAAHGGPASGLAGQIAPTTAAEPLVWIGFTHGGPPPYAPQTNIIVGLAPNGFTSASVQGRTVAIRANGFVLGDVTSRPPVYMTVRGPAGVLTAQLPSGNFMQNRGILQPPGKR